MKIIQSLKVIETTATVLTGCNDAVNCDLEENVVFELCQLYQN